MYLIEDIFQAICQDQCALGRMANPTDQDLFDFFVNQWEIKNLNFILVLEELLINAREHGGPPINLYYGQMGEYFLIALEDFGRGIHQTLPCNPRLADLKGKKTSGILRISLEEGITGTGIIGRGMGLFYLMEFISANNGEALLASDAGILIQNSNNFFSKDLAKQINRNLIIFQITKATVGR